MDGRTESGRSGRGRVRSGPGWQPSARGAWRDGRGQVDVGRSAGGRQFRPQIRDGRTEQRVAPAAVLHLLPGIASRRLRQVLRPVRRAIRRVAQVGDALCDRHPRQPPHLTHGRRHHKTIFAGFTGFGLLYITETAPETKIFLLKLISVSPGFNVIF